MALPQNPRQNPPWIGPAAPTKIVATATYNHEQPSAYPFSNAENPNLFPPVCLRSHWDPEQIIRRTLPTSLVGLPMDPRPWTKVCMTYVTSTDFEDSPRPNDDVVFPSGGTVYPITRFREAIDKESLLRRLDRPLGTCERAQYIPPRYSISTVPDRGHVSSQFIQELSFPQACMRTGDYDCRVEVGREAWARSPRLFNNTTKQDRYTEVRSHLNTGYPTPTFVNA